MPTLSQKSINMPASPIRRLVPFANAAKKRGIKVYHLNIGQPDIDAPTCAVDAVRALQSDAVAYTQSAGLVEYQEGLVDYYATKNINVNPSDIIVTNGGSEAVIFALITCLNPGDELMVPEPSYANYNGFAAQAGVIVNPILATIENDFALPPISEFEKKITPKTRAIMICNPGNPTGYLYSKEELLQLKEIALKHDLFIISDEVYREFCYDGNTHNSIMTIEGLEQHAVMIDSVSKRYSMCGARVGALVSRNKDLISAAMKLAQARLCPPLFGQIAALAALKTPKSYFENVYNEYIERRNCMVEELNKIEGVYCPKPKGAFYAIVKLPIDDSNKFAQWLLEEFSYENETVMVAPAMGFYSTKGLGKNEVRMAYVLKKDDLKRAIELLAIALDKYNNR